MDKFDIYGEINKDIKGFQYHEVNFIHLINKIPLYTEWWKTGKIWNANKRQHIISDDVDRQ